MAFPSEEASYPDVGTLGSRRLSPLPTCHSSSARLTPRIGTHIYDRPFPPWLANCQRLLTQRASHRHHCACSSPGTQRSASILSTEVQSIRTFGTARPKLREGDLLPDLGVATLDSLQVSLPPTRHTAPTPVKRLELHFPVDSPLQGTDFTILRRRPSAGTRKDSLRRDRPPFL